VIGEATRPQAVAFRARMTVLDVMIHVGGLTQFAAGNRSVIVRRVGDTETTIPLNLSDLLRDGELKNNVPVKPGDVIIIPQSLF
jgi:polysaccharide export outer membrane protein